MITGLSIAVGSGNAAVALLTLAWQETSSGRHVYRYEIQDAQGSTLARGTDLRSGVGDPVDHARMLATLLSFLTADGESYAHAMSSGRTPTDGYLFPEAVAEWAYTVSDELTAARLELEPDEA
jgi:hypothetical protein